MSHYIIANPLLLSGDSENDKNFINAIKEQEFPSFKKLEISNMKLFSAQEREVLGEFFHYTTPIAPNYLKYINLEGGEEMLLVFIDNLKYTLSVVTEEVYITNFVIDESTFCKLIESLFLVKRLAIVN